MPPEPPPDVIPGERGAYGDDSPGRFPLSASWLPKIVALVLALFATVPIVNLVPGGHEMPLYAYAMKDWMYGSMIVFGFAYILAVFSRQWALRAADKHVGLNTDLPQ